MSPSDVVESLSLPEPARVRNRIPKSVLVEHGAARGGDRKCVDDGVARLEWLGVVRPSTVALSPFVDEVHVYEELAVLILLLKEGARARRLEELIHRAIPYPVLLVTGSETTTSVSVANKRKALGRADEFVLEGDVMSVMFDEGTPDVVGEGFRKAVSIASRPYSDLRDLYERWVDAVVAVKAATRTHRFTMLSSRAEADARRSSLRRCAEIETQITELRRMAGEETQMAKRVALNRQVQKLRGDLDVVLGGL